MHIALNTKYLGLQFTASVLALLLYIIKISTRAQLSQRKPTPHRNIGVRLSLLSTVKTSLRISHLLENLKTANQKAMMYISNYCKHLVVVVDRH